MNLDNGILLAYIARDGVILAVARKSWSEVHNRYSSIASEGAYRDAVEETSQLLQEMAATPGWEFVKLPKLYRRDRDIPIRLRGAKFHILEGNVTWTCGCVYDYDAVDTSGMRSMFRKVMEAPLPVNNFMVHVERESRDFRRSDDVWLTGGYLALQHQFAPRLADIMHNVAWYDNLAQNFENIDELSAIMHRNVGLQMERGGRAEDLLEMAEETQEAAGVFRKTAKGMSDKARRQWYMLLALYGSVGAAVIAPSIAIPLVLLL